VIWGEQDPYLGAEWAEPDRHWVPKLRMERLSDAGHWPQIDQPERVNSILQDFLQPPDSHPRFAFGGDLRRTGHLRHVEALGRLNAEPRGSLRLVPG
jgi:hypothetical protein